MRYINWHLPTYLFTPPQSAALGLHPVACTWQSVYTWGVGQSHERRARYNGDSGRWRVFEAAESVPGPATPRRRPVELSGRRRSGGRDADLASTAGSSGRATLQPVVAFIRSQRAADTGDGGQVFNVGNYRLYDRAAQQKHKIPSTLIKKIF